MNWIEIYESLEAGAMENAIDAIFDGLCDLLDDDRFEECDAELAKIDLSRMEVNSLVAVLSATYMYRDKLPYRPALFQLTKEKLADQYGEDILFGLEGTERTQRSLH